MKPETRDKSQIERLNITSLEVSDSILGESIRSPRVVREIDWIDLVYKRIDPEKFPKVQKYCLMSPKNSFTDFHIDFGGTSVWYHIYQGMFLFLVTLHYTLPTPQ